MDDPHFNELTDIQYSGDKCSSGFRQMFYLDCENIK